MIIPTDLNWTAAYILRLLAMQSSISVYFCLLQVAVVFRPLLLFRFGFASDNLVTFRLRSLAFSVVGQISISTPMNGHCEKGGCPHERMACRSTRKCKSWRERAAHVHDPVQV